MAQKVNYSDLFDFTNDADVKKAINLIASLDKTYEKLVNSLKGEISAWKGGLAALVAQVQSLNTQLSKSNPLTKEGQTSIMQISKAAEMASHGYSNMTGRIEALGKAQNKLTSEQKAFNEKAKEAIKLQTEEARLSARLETLDSSRAKKVAELKAQIAAKNVEMKKAAKESLGLISIYDKEVQKLEKLRSEYKNVATQFGVNSKQARALRTELTQLDAKIKGVDASAGLFQRNVGNYRSALSGLAGGFRQVASALGFTGLIFALVAAFRGAFNTFVEFQRENAVLAGVLGVTRKEITLLSKDAIRLGSITAKTSTEVTKLQIEYARLGFSQAEILDLTEATINGSIAMNSELDQTAALVGAIVRSFDDLSSSDAEEIVDKLTLATNKSALSFAKLETSIPIVSAAANASKVPFSEMLAVLGKLSDAGVDASTAATAFRNILIESAARGKNYKELIDEVRTSTNQLTTANELFGKRGAVQAVILAKNTKALAELNRELSEEFAGKAGKAAEEQLNTVSGQAQLAKSAIEGFILSVESGDGVLSAFAKGALKITAEAFTALSNLDLLVSTMFKKFRSLSDEQILRLIDAGMVTESGKNVKDIVKQLDSIPFDKLSQKTDDYRERIVNLFVSEGESAIDAQRIFSVYFNERQRQYLALQQAQGQFEIALVNGIDTFEKFQDSYGRELELQKDGAEVLGMIQEKYAEAEKKKTEALVAGLSKISDGREKSIEQLKEELKLLKEQFVTVRDLDRREQLRAEIEALDEKIKSLTEEDKTYKEIGRSLDGLTAKQAKLDSEFKADPIGFIGVISNIRELPKELDKVNEAVAPKVGRFKQFMSDAGLAISDFISAGFNLASSAANQFFVNMDIRAENALKKFEDQKQSEIDILEERRERELANEQLTADQKAAINQRYASQIEGIETTIEKKRIATQQRAARNAKANAIFSSIINTASAVVEALPNVALATFVGILGAAQTGIIATQPLPAFAKGTDYAPGGPSIVGEKGRELVVEPSGSAYLTGGKAELRDIPEGSQILTNAITERILKQKPVEDMPGIYEKATSNLQKVARQEKLQLADFKKTIDLAAKQGNAELADFIARQIKAQVPISVLSLTDKGQLSRTVRVGGTTYKNVQLENKY